MHGLHSYIRACSCSQTVIEPMHEAEASVLRLLQQIRGDDNGAREAAIELLREKADLQGGYKQIVDAGGVEVLLGIVQDCKSYDRSHVLQLLKLLADEQVASTSIVSGGGIGALAKLIRWGNENEVAVAAEVMPKLTWGFSFTPLPVTTTDVAELVQLVQMSDDEKKMIGMKTLSMIAFGEVNQELMVAADCISLGAAIITTPSPVRVHAVAMLAHLALGVDIKPKRIIASARAIPSLIDITSDGTSIERVEAARALQGVATCVESHEVVVAAGGIEALLKLARDGFDAQKVPAMKVLAELSRVNTSNRAKLVAAGAIPVLVELIRTRAGFYEQDALLLLRVIAIDAANKTAILESGGVEPLVALVRYGAEWLRILSMEVLSTLALVQTSLQSMISAELHPLLLQLATKGTSAEQRVAVPLLQLLMDFAIAQKQHS